MTDEEVRAAVAGRDPDAGESVLDALERRALAEETARSIDHDRAVLALTELGRLLSALGKDDQERLEAIQRARVYHAHAMGLGIREPSQAEVALTAEARTLSEIRDAIQALAKRRFDDGPWSGADGAALEEVDAILETALRAAGEPERERREVGSPLSRPLRIERAARRVVLAASLRSEDPLATEHGELERALEED